MPLTILHVVRDLDAASGGPSRSVPALAAAMAGAGADVHLLAGQSPRPLADAAGVNVRLVEGSLAAAAEALLAGREQAVVCVHGLWDLRLQAVAKLALRRRWPLLVSIRGMLEPAALAHRAWKKRLAWPLYQRGILRRADLLHATATHEAQSIRRAGLTNPILVCPHGVDLPSAASIAAPAEAPERHSILFLGRLHPIKNLPVLLKAWAEAGRPGWELVLAGPDESGHRAVLEAQLASLGIGAGVRFTGSLEGEAKRAALASAHVLVLPSASENFGMAVAEALAAGVPAIATTGTPWQALPAAGCGWWVVPEPGALAAALREAMDLTPDDRAAMGRRARDFIADGFSWPAVGARFLEACRWLAGTGPRPPVVHDAQEFVLPPATPGE